MRSALIPAIGAEPVSDWQFVETPAPSLAGPVMAIYWFSRWLFGVFGAGGIAAGIMTGQWWPLSIGGIGFLLFIVARVLRRAVGC